MAYRIMRFPTILCYHKKDFIRYKILLMHKNTCMKRLLYNNRYMQRKEALLPQTDRVTR